MEYQIVGEIGSTGADWAILSGANISHIQTIGYNPVTQHSSQLSQMLSELKQKSGILQEKIEVYYYGAGVTDAFNRKKIVEGLQTFFRVKRMICESDLLGAARVLSKDASGIICILGTGSNACYYNGKKLFFRSGSLGYPLGDEGSGWDIGKNLIKAFYYRELPDKIYEKFAVQLPAHRHDFLNDLAGQSAPNQFLATFAKLGHEHKEDIFIRKLIKNRFQSFIRHHVSRYENLYPVHFVGSIAFYFQDILDESLKGAGYRLGTVLQKPIEALASYHFGIS